MKNIPFIFRMHKKNPLLVFVTLPGLAMGLSAVLLLLFYLNYEFSFDKHFSTKDRVLRLYNNVVENNQSYTYGICLRRAYTGIPSKVPEIEASTQLYDRGRVMIKSANEYFSDLKLLSADQGFFDVFGLNILYGDRKTALEGAYKIVLTSSTAQKIFNDLDCVGKMVSISGQSFMISGVMKDLPNNSHFNFDLLCSMETLHPEMYSGLEFFTYYLIRENSDTQLAGRKIAEINDVLMKPWASEFKLRIRSGTEPLSTLHLHSSVNNDLSPKADLNILLTVAGIALFILLIAMVNYINLYLLHGEKRIAEIAVRKTLGADQRSLTRLFYSETGLISLSAFILAILLTIWARPYFCRLMQRSIALSDLFSSSGIVLMLSFLVFVILVSGAYPGFYLSSLSPVTGFKGRSSQIAKKSKLSIASVLLQFTITIFLISSLVIIYTQINYLKNIPLGFSPENVVGINVINPEGQRKYKTILEELEHLPFIECTGSSFHTIGEGGSGEGIKVYGDPGKQLQIDSYRVQPGFCETVKLELLDGHFFNKGKIDTSVVILNEAAAKMLGLKDPVGSLVEMFGYPMTVIGLVRNFYFADHPGEPVKPLVLYTGSNNLTVIYFRIRDQFAPDKQMQVEKIFKNYDPDFIFSYFRLTDIYLAKYNKEEKVMKLVSTGAILALLISIMGLMALSILNVNRRTKEIGIRKISGSSEIKILMLLLKETFVLVLIAMMIASVFCYIVMQHWLSNFANKIGLHPGYLLLSAFLVLMIALLTVGWQSWKAATRNPVEALRYE